mmetsp:Transcript_2197/g.6057  ORF Transcript_2197/g.6057 Transcript_2197/m.6057 type:complete len:199 (-) Transcript_2197:101-697(-)
MERAKRSRYNWTEEKKVALLTQIVATGNVGFLTAKDAKVGEEFVSQLDVWTNAETGIIPLLNMHAPEFKDNPITSTYTSVITSVRDWVQAESHLYTSGKEQGAERAHRGGHRHGHLRYGERGEAHRVSGAHHRRALPHASCARRQRQQPTARRLRRQSTRCTAVETSESWYVNVRAVFAPMPIFDKMCEAGEGNWLGH